VSEAVRRLPGRQRLVITRHFGFDGDAVPISRIAGELQLSPQRVRSVERSAFRGLADDLGPLLGRDGRGDGAQ